MSEVENKTKFIDFCLPDDPTVSLHCQQFWILHDLISPYHPNQVFALAFFQSLIFNCECFRSLDPPLSENESFDLLKVCVNGVFALPPDTHTPEKTKDEEILDPKQRKVTHG